ncbi:hypothetical protein A5886_000538 [Enterococcus sp. 8G7_MSG3316]|uniref:HTH gntR-type domain-containing protein n=1 Tax=Candidatus Enterococcus testudinis TaxID=1834191 RepID=A0A242A348_9ENTE|nr:GntR family transcriptional regulator [Enterococcus sp. 8G7_MSG3316]OTN75468.1 hypothetical protein A5886_000538 [Enterococcus sp. 8G7_MSG3316]
MPKYLEIADELRKRIKDGTYPKDSFLPYQTELVEEFGVSRMTIKNAVNILIMEGLLLTKRGSGTKVLNHSFAGKDTSSVTEYKGLSYQMKQEKRRLTSQVITFEVCFPDERIQEMLQVTAEQPVYHVIRLRILEDNPYILEHSFMPVDLVSGLTKDILEDSVYEYILQDLGYRFAGAYRTFQAAKSDQYDQRYLDCKEDDPVLELEQIIYLESGRPIDYSYSRNRYDVKGYSMLDMKPDLMQGYKK